MPITVNELVEKVGLDPKSLKKVKWGTPVSTKKEGVYIVSLSTNPKVNVTVKYPVFNIDLLKKWIEDRGYFILDGIKCYAEDVGLITNRLSKFWLPDENIIYIGKASNLHVRIGAFYRHKIGKKSPHAGGHWIKILQNIEELILYYIECDNCIDVEKRMFTIFGEQISEESQKLLFDKNILLPFANIKNEFGKNKNYGIDNMNPKQKHIKK